MERSRIIVLVGIAAVVATVAWIALRDHGAGAPAPDTATPVLSVTLIRPERMSLPRRVAATGSVAAWQEASVGAESNGLRLSDVLVNVGDDVKRGQVLARFSPELVQAELAEANAAVALARAEADEAANDQRRAQALDAAGVMSRQQVSQYQAVALTTRARLEAAQAAQAKARLRVTQAQVLAPGDGTISARAATVGAVVPAGQELFRLILAGRLEWRAAVSSSDLPLLRPGQRATLTVPGAPPMEGTLRMLAPAIDSSSRSGMVYVDLPQNGVLRAGSFAQGHIEVGSDDVVTLPPSAVLNRDGFHYVMSVGQAGFVRSRKVTVGRQGGDHIEIAAGLASSEWVVGSGLGFLNDGDAVRVLNAAGSHKAAP